MVHLAHAKRLKQKKYKTILYLTAVEDAFNKAVIRSQVFRLFPRYQKVKGINVFFLAFVPFRFYFKPTNPIQTFCEYRNNRKKIRDEYNSKNIHIVFFPFFFPFKRKYFYMKTLHLFVFLVQTIPLLLFFLMRENVSLIHARSYPACLISYICGNFLKIKYLFEMRGFYPDEGVVYGVYQNTSSYYKQWKNIERKLIQYAHSVVVESQIFKEYVMNIFPHNNISVIPCYVDNNIYRFNKKWKEKLKDEFKLKDKLVFTYSGTIGGWHDPGLQADYFLQIKKRIPKTHFLILTFPQYNEIINSTMGEKHIGQSEYTLLNPSTSEVPRYLLMGDVGMLVINDLPTAKKAVSVKFGEYLACGLPVLCTPYVGGAAQLIKKYECGIIVDLAVEKSFDQIHHLIKNYKRIQANGLRLAKNYLSVEINARKFLEIYHET